MRLSSASTSSYQPGLYALLSAILLSGNIHPCHAAYVPKCTNCDPETAMAYYTIVIIIIGTTCFSRYFIPLAALKKGFKAMDVYKKSDAVTITKGSIVEASVQKDDESGNETYSVKVAYTHPETRDTYSGEWDRKDLYDEAQSGKRELDVTIVNGHPASGMPNIAVDAMAEMKEELSKAEVKKMSRSCGQVFWLLLGIGSFVAVFVLQAQHNMFVAMTAGLWIFVLLLIAAVNGLYWFCGMRAAKAAVNETLEKLYNQNEKVTADDQV